MATAQPQSRMTAEEFWDRYQEREDHPCDPERGFRDVELWDGVVVEGEVASYRHQKTLTWLEVTLDPWVRAKGGRTWNDGGVKFGPHDVRGPDLMVWWSGQPFDPDGMFRATPDLVVEVVSPQPRDVRRDREEKLIDYCAHGIPHYWIVEPIHRVFEAYLRTSVASRRWEYRRSGLWTSGVIEVLGFKGLTLDLDACWRAGE
jgi:Uma2 family endonuclease